MLQNLVERFKIELNKHDRSGIYAVTSRELAYNSNKIEGSTLTKDQTAALFDMGVLPQSEDYYRAKDIEEMNGHFLMFNKMIETLESPFDEKLIKEFHYTLKAGVFEDRANGYAIGDYKKRPNIIGNYETTSPNKVPYQMKNLLDWYKSEENTIERIVEFHARYECIHPFQDGNGRTGRLIAFRECLKAGVTPFIIEDINRVEYIFALGEYREKQDTTRLVKLVYKEQEEYYKLMEKFLENN